MDGRSLRDLSPFLSGFEQPILGIAYRGPVSRLPHRMFACCEMVESLVIDSLLIHSLIIAPSFCFELKN